MSPKTKLSTISRRFRFLLVVIFFFIPLVQIFIWSSAYMFPESFVRPFMYKHVIGQIHGASYILAFLVCMIRGAVVMLGIKLLIDLFRLYEAGVVFELANVACFKNLSRVLILWFFAGIISGPLMSLALTMNNPVGKLIVTVSLEYTDLTALVIGGILMVITRVMEIGRELQNEQDYTI